MELGNAEPVGVFDDHDRGLGHVHPDFDHRGGDQHVEHACPKVGHDHFLLARTHLAVEKADMQVGQLPLLQPGGLLGDRCGLDPVRTLDQRAHYERTMTGGHLGPDPFERCRLVHRGTGPVGGDRGSARRKLVDGGHVEIAKDDHGRRARDRSGGHHQQVGVGPRAVFAPALGFEPGPLLHPEPVLLVDDNCPERLESDLVGQQGVRAD